MKSISRKNLKWNSLELQKHDICTYSCYWRIFNYLNRNAAEVICPFLAVYFILARSSFLLSLWTLLPDSLGRHVVVEKIGTKLNYLRPFHYGKVFCLFSNFFHLIFLLLFTLFSLLHDDVMSHGSQTTEQIFMELSELESSLGFEH